MTKRLELVSLTPAAIRSHYARCPRALKLHFHLCSAHSNGSLALVRALSELHRLTCRMWPSSRRASIAGEAATQPPPRSESQASTRDAADNRPTQLHHLSPFNTRPLSYNNLPPIPHIFLSHTQRGLHLLHPIHSPFPYSVFT